MEMGIASNASKQKNVVLKVAQNHGRKKKSLVGKILTQKNLNYPTVVSMITKAWQVEDGVEILDMDRSSFIFLFRFNRDEDFFRILRGRPWNILGHLLNLQEWEDDMVLQEVSFDSAPFWVQFHGLPVEVFDSENAKTLGGAVGDAVMFENPMVDGKMRRAFIRVRSLIRVNEPLVSGFWVPREAKEPVWVKIRYERLQNFCFKCGCLVHDGKGCKADFVSKVAEECREYGPWLSTQGVRTLDDIVVVCRNGWPEVQCLGSASQSGRSLANLQSMEGPEAGEGFLVQPSFAPPAEVGSQSMALNSERGGNGPLTSTAAVGVVQEMTTPASGHAPKVAGGMVTNDGQRDVGGLTTFYGFKVGDDVDMACGVAGPSHVLADSNHGPPVMASNGPFLRPCMQYLGKVKMFGPDGSAVGCGLQQTEDLDGAKNDMGSVVLNGPDGQSFYNKNKSANIKENGLAFGLTSSIGNEAGVECQSMKSILYTGLDAHSPMLKEDDIAIKDNESLYIVDFPSDDEGKNQALIPFNGSSPIAEISAGLDRISLKRPFQEEVDSYISNKCRRVEFEPKEETPKAKDSMGRSMRG
ncbi:hypothetical protein QN277_013744 [Acacia crassicarpa]|uniref:DUF4283 domain-containing protein n=1 Tax=Acacia crassicarpa TaxID=499986 RepID=A0AAE1N3X5_9FABA|nr:hypothetical protein QN277_013744 [Acacia crassicarpa]